MKRKRLLLIGALVAAAFGLARAGCAQNRLTTDDLIEMGYVNKVTFDLMGGKSGERTELSSDESIHYHRGFPDCRFRKAVRRTCDVPA